MKLSAASDAKWTALQDDELRRHVLAGRSSNEIALRLKRSPLAVVTRIKKLGIKKDGAT